MLLPISRQMNHIPEDSSVNVNSRKVCYVTFMINFEDAERKKIVPILGKLVQDLGSNFGF